MSIEIIITIISGILFVFLLLLAFGTVFFICLYFSRVIYFLFAVIVHLISELFALCFRPFFILSNYGEFLCQHCFLYSRPLRARYYNGIRCCENCDHPIDQSHPLIHQVVGLIGGDIENYRIDGHTAYVNLWFQDEEKSRNADIDILEIRKSSRKINYEMALNSVFNVLINDPSRKRDWLKRVPVIIDSGLKLPANSINLLTREFGEIQKR